MENGASAEIAVVGNDGIVGTSLFMGGDSTPSRAVVQSAGQGFRLEAQALKDEFNKAGPVMHLLLRYTQALITHMTQTAVCNRHHSLDQQLCRWLLLSLDRLQANELVMTQELIAKAAWRSPRRSSRGCAQIAGCRIDTLCTRPHFGAQRQGLEDRTCECYAVVKKNTTGCFHPWALFDVALGGVLVLSMGHAKTQAPRFVF